MWLVWALQTNWPILLTSVMSCSDYFIDLSITGFHHHHHHHHHHLMVFLEWPKQQPHHEDHYSQSKYEQYQTVL